MSDTDVHSRRAVRIEQRAQHARRRRQKIKALAASGLVFGIGTSVTIAAWTDQEFATGTFEAGTFQLEANIDGTWQSTEIMQFNGSNMFPGNRVYESVLIRTSPTTTYDAAVTLRASEVSGDLAPYLRYRTVASAALSPSEADAFTCGPGNFTADASPYVYGGPETFLTMSSLHTSEDELVVMASGNDVAAYCFEVELDPATPSSAQGSTTGHEWTWEAESIVSN